MIRILHIVEDFSIASGGLRTAINNLDQHLKSAGFYSYILSSDKEREDEIYLVDAKNKWLYSPLWAKQIRHIVEIHKINIIHIHGVWLYPQLAGAIYAVQNKVPFVLSTHGMLQPWLWRKGKIKKKIYFNLISKKWFSKASVVHAVTSDESMNLRKYFPKNKFIEIPNLIDVDHASEPKITEKPEVRYILYIGRLNKTKGIDLLIKVFSEIEDNDLKLLIAGGFNKYKIKLDKLIRIFDRNNKIEFLGTVKGQQKLDLIKNAWVMVSPSYSDVIGLVNLEAASLKTPVITTFNTGLKPEWNQNGGKLINPNIDELKQALAEVLKWTPGKRIEEGEKLFNYVKDQYSWESQLEKWIELYIKVLN